MDTRLWESLLLIHQKLSLDKERALVESHAKSIGADYAVCYRNYLYTSQGIRHITVPLPRKYVTIDTSGTVYGHESYGDFSLFKRSYSHFNANTVVTLPRTYKTYSIPYSIDHYKSYVMYWSKSTRQPIPRPITPNQEMLKDIFNHETSSVNPMP